ncbi:unnamed protein product [Plutella xylostella]|uniref:(diamondback moth) hypothetical protein n=1 Tax=Plutella xylostella TaxID=51655 RepID=A0A8S4GDF3_PLUXY|nr:unnamed protein product [Plutella xylostella]
MCDMLQTVKDELRDIENECFNSVAQDELYESKPSLLTLPVEVFLKICSFLDGDYISKTLRNVCTRFEDIFADEELWKYWASSRMKYPFPPLPNLKIWEEKEPNWEDVFVDIDKESKRWVNAEETMRHVVIKDVHFASVDTVLLVRNGEVCISGGRDRGLALWDVMSVSPHDQSQGCPATTVTTSKPHVMRYDAHAGWVWDLAADNPDDAGVVYSASWDNTVKAWDLATGLTCVETFKCGMSALSVATSDNIVMAGLYSKNILGFDIRAGPNPITSYKTHKGPVLALNHFENKIASVSEDRTLAVYDRVAGKVLVSDLKIPMEKAFPVCISWTPTALYIGDSKGGLHLIDPEALKYESTHHIWPKEEKEPTKPCKITGCIQTLGNLILCSDKGEIKFFHNSYPPSEFATVKTATLDVTQLRYQNDVLVIGTCDSALEFWVPKEKFPDF